MQRLGQHDCHAWLHTQFAHQHKKQKHLRRWLYKAQWIRATSCKCHDTNPMTLHADTYPMTLHAHTHVIIIIWYITLMIMIFSSCVFCLSLHSAASARVCKAPAPLRYATCLYMADVTKMSQWHQKATTTTTKSKARALNLN